MFKHTQVSLLSTGLAAALCGLAFPVAATNLPDVQHSAGGSFMTGGVGLDESTAMKGVMKDWPIAMQFAEKDGQRADYVADVRVAVTDANGHSAIDTVSQGPFLLADVQPGTWKVAATLGKQTLHKVVEVKKGKPVRLTFVWPASAADLR